LTGKVEVRNRYGLKKGAQLEAGQARVAGPGGRWKETPLRRDHFLSKLPSTEPDFTNAALIRIPPENVTASFNFPRSVSRINSEVDPLFFLA